MNNIGEYLKNTRMAKNFSIEDVAEATGIRSQYLEALEKGEYAKIPGDVFIKGFIRNYGNYLGLSGNDLVEQYKRRNQDVIPNEPIPAKETVTPQNIEATTAGKRPAEDSVQEREEDSQETVSPEEDEPQKKGFLGGAWSDLKAFVIDNIYETVDEDDDDSETAPTEKVQEFVPEKEQIPVNKASSHSSFFSVKVFGIVFVLCMLIFVGVMGYFMLSGTSSKPINANTGFSGTVKSAHSTEKATDKKAADQSQTKKEDQSKKDDKKTEEKTEEKTKDKDSKTLGTGEGVTVEITVNKPCWTQVTADGKTLEAATLQPGTTRVYKGSKEVKVNVGSIKYVSIKVNGKEVPVSDKEWGEATKVFRK